MHMKKDSILLLTVVWLLGIVALSACGAERQNRSVAPTVTAMPGKLIPFPEPTQSSASDLAAATSLGFNIRGWS